MKPAKVAIIDDHPVLSSVLAEILSREPDFRVVGTAASGTEGLELCARTQPSLVLLDMVMPGTSGLEVITRLRQQNPDAAVLAFSGMYSKELANMAFLAGAHNYVSKSSSIEDLLRSLRAVRDGRVDTTPEMAAALRWSVLERRIHKTLSTGDMEILQLYVQNKSVKEVACQVGHTSSAVYKVLKKLRNRLAVKTFWELRLSAEPFGLLGSYFERAERSRP